MTARHVQRDLAAGSLAWCQLTAAFFFLAAAAAAQPSGAREQTEPATAQNPSRMKIVPLKRLAPPVSLARPQVPPRVFLLNAAELAAIRPATLAGAGEFAPALAQLRHEADKALTAGPFSVMDKTSIPPSGDKHDYMSLSIYSWPNPATPDHLPYVTRDGQVNPDSAGPMYDATSLGRMLNAVETLALAYYLTGVEAYADHAGKLLRVWFLDGDTRMNPNMIYSEIVPGRTSISGGGIIQSIEFTRMVDAAGLLDGSDSWAEQDEAGLVAWFSQLLDWLQNSPQGKLEVAAVNNHGSWYDAQVADFALFAGRGDIATVRAGASGKARVALQIEPDGTQPHELARTKSFQYSAYNLEALFYLATVGERVGVDLWNYTTADGRSLRKAFDFLLQFADGTKPWPYPEIVQINFFSLLAPLLSRAAVAYPDGHYAERLQQLFPQQTPLQRLQLRVWALRVLT